MHNLEGYFVTNFVKKIRTISLEKETSSNGMISDEMISQIQEILNELEGRRYYAKFKKIDHLKLIKLLVDLAMESVQGSPTDPIPTTMNITKENGKIDRTIHLKCINFFQVLWYEQALEKKLKGKKLLDYVNAESKTFIKTARKHVANYLNMNNLLSGNLKV